MARFQDDPDDDEVDWHIEAQRRRNRRAARRRTILIAGLAGFFVVALIVVIAIVSSRQTGANNAVLLLGRWEHADGSGKWIEFSPNGKMRGYGEFILQGTYRLENGVLEMDLGPFSNRGRIKKLTAQLLELEEPDGEIITYRRIH